MKRTTKKNLSLSRETVRPLAHNELVDARGAMQYPKTHATCAGCASVPQTGCTSCPSFGPKTYCCLSTEATFC